jgi:hypothetical protein
MSIAKDVIQGMKESVLSSKTHIVLTKSGWKRKGLKTLTRTDGLVYKIRDYENPNYPGHLIRDYSHEGKVHHYINKSSAGYPERTELASYLKKVKPNMTVGRRYPKLGF